MDKMRIRGGIALRGTVEVSGSKNAALPILISTLLTPEACRFERVPDLEDIQTTLKLLGQMGAAITPALDQNRVTVKCDAISSQEAPYDLVRKMRASVVVLGPLLARFGRAKVSLPGGCAIGARPINFHLAGLERLGAAVELDQGYVIAEAKRLTGAKIVFEFPSVGATENVLMAAVLARGESVLENCAREPEIVDLARALRAMGAEIEGEGTEVIRVQGKAALHGCDYRIMGDRIEAGTYLAAGLATGGSVKVNGLSPTYMDSILAKFEDAGAKVVREADGVQVIAVTRPRPIDIKTLPYPGFPTDMQAQFMAAMAVAEGASVITETIFENRFMHVPELIRLGADITVRGNSALIRGRPKLLGAPLMATDLRASASLVLGGLCAAGETVVNRIYHLDRGYESMEKKLASLGADIERIS
ncbi:MAG TPA: UDP-N-acetylglucosamine 1-carboxyvinyltransferase [Bdellovibrionota bacterium]|nr:UDP-N-acetylglucosamine 1-carboxyvinyltransferase [Bdellovibrionota bacterium]